MDVWQAAVIYFLDPPLTSSAGIGECRWLGREADSWGSPGHGTSSQANTQEDWMVETAKGAKGAVEPAWTRTRAGRRGPECVGLAWALGLGLGFSWGTSGTAAAGGEVAKPWTVSATAAVREAFDSNVFLQDVTGQADRESMVTTLIPSLGLSYRDGSAWQWALQYAPEAAFFHSESTEDHVLHRVGLNGSGKVGALGWDWQNGLVVIDGSDVGPTFTGQGGAPAAGGPQVRDRRDAAIYRGGVRVTRTVGKWWVRPVVSVYLHDFQTRHRSTPGYLNFVDRNDLNGGMDLGWEPETGTRVGIGYRYGAQDQAQLLSYPEQYDSQYHRILGLAEGSPRGWLTVSIAVGPEFREYGDHVPAAFGDREVLNLFVDASVTFRPTAADSLVLSAKQFEQPGFAGRSTYEDLTYDVIWRHKLSEAWAFSVVGRAYSTDFQAPVLRDDWVLSGSLAVT